ncbi:hypothetical protein EBL89_18285 [Cereibacter sphaeroides]|uniref:hypothetical protein n=1 Tax=Cereibacter sphaeroides TaxID=1063 RepID=UPI000F531BC5|nr:hypothetical protein [Cereibacter sphaeroides]AZB57241.1 hypothetical protein EBL89_18285 [Cereibacter sphaeroides]AZB61525.1 hypothetical protein EBL88_18395 [Cereibacter sphaeroides]
MAEPRDPTPDEVATAPARFSRDQIAEALIAIRAERDLANRLLWRLTRSAPADRFPITPR